MTGHKKNFLAIAGLIFVITIITISIYKRQQTDIKYTRTLMGTVVEITLSGRNETSLNTAAEAAFNEIKRLEGLMSHYTNDSDVARINKAAGKDAVAVSMETMEVIEASLEISEITNGAFDITMGILGNVWHFTTADNNRSERDGG
ncbi:MAG: FAD:protein FMN transferase, partial [Deltaproteobacteria bacterium]